MRRVEAVKLLIILACSIMASTEAFADRIALVIGNSAYRNVPVLKNTLNDARAVSTTLREVGFRTIDALDVDRRAMNEKIREFLSQVKGGDEALVYYAGHGVEVDGANYMLPIDVPLLRAGQERALRDDAVNLNQLITDLEANKTRVSLIILDACRDNPFPRQGTRSLGATRGLSQAAPPEGVFILYSAGPNQTALDNLGPSDTNPNGLFTRSLLSWMKREGVEITELAKNVRLEVARSARTLNHQQSPGFYYGLDGDFFFRPSPTRNTSPLAASNGPSAAQAGSSSIPALPATTGPASPTLGRNAPPDPWQTLPFTSEAERNRVKAAYLAAPHQKVLAMTPKGQAYWRSAMQTETPVEERIRVTLEACEFEYREPCFVAATWETVSTVPIGGFRVSPQPSLSRDAMNATTIMPSRTPFVLSANRGLVMEYNAAEPPKAAAIHRLGHFHKAGGASSADAQAAALQNCNEEVRRIGQIFGSSNLAECYLYAVDNKIVLLERRTKPPATAALDAVPLPPSGPRAPFRMGELTYVQNPVWRNEIQEFTARFPLWSIAVHPTSGVWGATASPGNSEDRDRVALQRCEFMANEPCFIHARNGEFITTTTGPQVVQPKLTERGAYDWRLVPFIATSNYPRAESYGAATGAKAMAIHPNGTMIISYSDSGPTAERDAQANALKICNDVAKNSYGKPCVLFAVGNSIIFHRRSTVVIN